MRSPAAADDGFAPTEFVLFTGVVLLPTLMLVLFLPTWWERQMLGRAAAQEAARAVVLAHSWDHGVAAGEELVAAMAANHGVPDADMAVLFGGALERGQSVTATVAIAVPAASVGPIALPAFTLTTSHTEAVDLYRSIAEESP